jgi:hypothetical protein
MERGHRPISPAMWQRIEHALQGADVEQWQEVPS